MSLVKRITLYFLVLIPALGLFVNNIHSKRFNTDEFQHTHLAWAATHFDKLQYRDLWDNHGPLYTVVNSIFIKSANLGADVSTYLAERYLNLLILLLGFLILFELFRSVTGKWYFAILGPWFFVTSQFSRFATQVRPDNLQCLFFYLALLLLVKAFQKENHKLAFASGLSLALMLMTNLKSLSALAAILVSLVLLSFMNKESQAMSYLRSLVTGLALLASVFLIALVVGGFMPGYINDNIMFNFVSMQMVEEAAVKQISLLYTKRHHLLLPLLGISLGFWLYKNLKSKTINPAWFLVLVTSSILAISRLKIHLWGQYDLLFIPLLCFIASCFVFYLLEKLILSKINSQVIKLLVISPIFIGFVYAGWKKVIHNPRPLARYHQFINERIAKVTELVGEDGRIENCGRHVPELGFLEIASRRIHQHPFIMAAHEKLNSEDLHGASYVKLLKERNVKVILASKNIFKFCHSPEFQDHLEQNYVLHDYFWLYLGDKS
ncbi:MAG: hypothetical protein OXU45_07520 [Candidatus Melainabacteria bacterium]|nr:hypothetical protein [Candidatus Melainabacteria bacterium]